MKYKFALAVCARWESLYIVEWLTYYQLLGFDHVFLYCNDDAPEEMYGLVLPFLLGPRPFVTFRHHAVQGEQYWMYVHFLRHHLDECEWVGFLDVDEFIRLPRGQSVGEFVSSFGDDVDCLLFNWLNFGTGGYKTPPPGRVLRNYTKRERGLHPYTKFVARAAIFRRDWLNEPEQHSAFWHIPEGKILAGAKLRNVLGEDMAGYYEGFPERAKAFVDEPARKQRILNTAVVQHYYLRSEQAFHERVARGLGGEFGGQTLWRDMAESATFASYLDNINIITDDALAGFWPDVLSRAAASVTVPEPTATPAAAPDADASNLARGRPATQSSVSQWSRGATPAEDAAGAVDGQPTGERKFHTGWEDAPWWQVDLGAPRTISEIRIYNAIDSEVRRRFKRFRISIGFDEDSFVEVFRKDDDAEVGGVNRGPFIWRPELAAFARLVRITAAGPGFLHLDQVEVYGRGPTPAPVVGPDHGLFERFISLGDNCEFGIVQQEAGVASLDLLRFGGNVEDESGLILALEERFETFCTPADLNMTETGVKEWISRSRSGNVYFHTFKFSSEIDRETIAAEESQRLRFLARKLVRDLENAEKIFLRKSSRPVPDETMFRMFRAMRAYGDVMLIWVSLADATHPHATLQYMAPGFLRAFIRRLAPVTNATDVRIRDWREVCAAVVATLA